MYNISAEELELFRKCYRQTALIKVYGIPGLTDITDADILANGLVVDRYCFPSKSLEIGTAIASEMSLTLDNCTGKFDGVDFDGVTFSVAIGIKKWDAKPTDNATICYVPLGVYTVDEKSKNASTIVLNALDNMAKFDRPYDTDLSYPATLEEILQDACAKCGVIQYTTDFTNASYQVVNKPSAANLTYRQVIQWVAELAGANAWMDWDGVLRLSWFENTDLTISGADRYDSDEEEYSVTITGVKVVTSDGDASLVGENGYILNIDENGLVQSGANVLAHSIYDVVGGFSYLPYSCTMRPAPFLFPMDRITYIDHKGNEHSTIVSAVTYIMNGVTTVSGEGIGTTQGNYSPTDGVTKQEKIIIEKVKKDFEKNNTEKYSILLHLNQIIGGAFGLYQTEIEDNGVKTFYLHDKSTLADSTIIYVFNAGGFAWTDDWNNGQPVWKYGFTQNGNAVYHILSAYKIQTEYLEAGSVTAEKLSQTYKSSVDKAISDGDVSVTQAFIAADGVLDSSITAEKTRAEGIEETLSSRISANATEISAKVNRTYDDSSSSFGWTLTEDEFSVRSNGKSVMSITPSGGLAVQGNITATSGVIGGCKIENGILCVSAANIIDKLTASKINADGITASGVTISGNITATSGTFSNCVIDNTCTIKGTLTSDIICTNESTNDRAKGEIKFDTLNGIYASYIMRVTDQENSRRKSQLYLGYREEGRMTCGLTSPYQIDGDTMKQYGYYTSGQGVTYLTAGYTINLEVPDMAKGTIWLKADNLRVINNTSVEIGTKGTNTSIVMYGQTSQYFTAQIANNWHHDDNIHQVTVGTYLRAYAKAQNASAETLTCEMWYNYGSRYFNISSKANSIAIGSTNASGNNVLEGTWQLQSGAIVSSDVRVKHDITDVSDKYDLLFDALKPRLYRYNNGTSGRLHSGFVAQEVADAMQTANVPTSDFAAYCVDKAGTENEVSGLRYEEFVALNTWQIQRLKTRIAIMERMIKNG